MTLRLRLRIGLIVVAALACRQPDRTPIVETVRIPAAPVTTAVPGSDSAIAIEPASRWPLDPKAYQLANLDSLNLLVVPECGTSSVISDDGVGPLRPGMTLTDVDSRCPAAPAIWDIGEKGSPVPVLVVNMKGARFVLSFADTLTTSQLTTITTSDTTARTATGAGPGTLFSDLRGSHGIAALVAEACALHATFRSLPALSFRLDTGRFLKCQDMEVVARDNSLDRLPPTAKVQAVIVSAPGAMEQRSKAADSIPLER